MNITIVKYGQVSTKEMQDAQHPAYYLINELAKTHSLDVITYGNKFSSFNLPKIRVHNLPIICFGALSRLRMFILYVFWQTYILAHLIASKPNKVVCIGCNTEIFIPNFYCGLFRKKLVIVVAQQVNPDGYNSNLVFKLIKRTINSDNVQQLLPISEEVKQDLIACKISRKKMKRVDYIRPRDNQFHIVEKKPSKFTVLFIGRLVKPKGIYELVEVAKILKKKGLKIQFNLIGQGPEEQKLQNTINDAGLEHSIRLIGKVPYARIPAYFSKAHVLFLPTKTEALGQVVIEAFLSGIPVISTKLGGVKELVEHNITGYLHNPNDILKFAKDIQLLATNNKKYQDMRTAIISRNERFFQSKQSIIDALNEP